MIYFLAGIVLGVIFTNMYFLYNDFMEWRDEKEFQKYWNGRGMSDDDARIEWDRVWGSDE